MEKESSEKDAPKASKVDSSGMSSGGVNSGGTIGPILITQAEEESVSKYYEFIIPYLYDLQTPEEKVGKDIIILSCKIGFDELMTQKNLFLF